MMRQQHILSRISSANPSVTCSVLLLLVLPVIQALTRQPAFVTKRTQSPYRPTSLSLFAPPGSGYAQPDEESSFFPDTYDPMMEYPGTMRPGRTPENIPFHDLPIADTDPDPVPWPHFQQIEWHHRWEPPHEHPIPMEEFIELHGRWATPEFEATMRAGVRRSLMEQRETAEAEKKTTIITDDEEDMFDDEGDKPVGLGEGIFGQMGSAVKPKEKNRVEEDDDTSAELDDFLLDLGLDLDLNNKQSSASKGALKTPSPAEVRPVNLSFDDSEEDNDEDDEEDVGEVAATIAVEDDGDITLDIDDDDDLEVSSEVPLEDYGDSDSLDTEDIFGEGGFDFDDGDFEAADGFDMDDW
ncbi:hypothetical protein MPSEU_000895800 [Mayamaea pseudoterrestris]|nr:hypothetical protein MPSEU_000895800 [Mayamaea pseudoterrestris]